ncbi:cellulose biosynthesis protein BcsN [Bosea sp. 685]|uniref:cellulose biosynthesis protein BcsN n=1 Tax=Bosea sp. 685 TaxID=3080057 RepID=UPI00289335E5|nr:cellulose biosynthesis protein BcsN [Bosea sp. 685]WNJ89971.1 cellulose biosynthesis protein BcsN [Bosea sp. 685]
MSPSFPSRLRRATFAALTGVATLSAAGCSQPRDAAATQPLESLAGAPAAATWSALQPEAALLYLPDRRDRATALREQRPTQGVMQEIELPARGGTGRNLLTLAVHSATPVPGLFPGKPSEAGIKAEIAAAFPGRALRIVSQPRRNGFGPYGLAVATGPDGQRCVYAWQWLERDDKRVRDALGGAASWRARICRKTQTLDEIAAALDEIAIGLQPDIANAPAPSPARAANPTRTRAAQPAPATRQARSAEPAAALPSPAPDGQRYLAAVSSAQRPPAGPVGAQAMLDQSLPAEAYRGPMARTAQIPRPALREAAVPRSAIPVPD